MARRALFDLYGDALQARLDLDLGNDQAAFDQATQVATRIRALELSKDADGRQPPSNVAAVRANFLRNALATLTLAALRTGRYGEAEAAARERAALPPNPFSELDPQDERSRAQVTLAHALVLQGRTDEARAITDVEIPRYQAELQGRRRRPRLRQGLLRMRCTSMRWRVRPVIRAAASNLAEALRQLGRAWATK